jgi:site-specific recombinase XerD
MDREESLQRFEQYLRRRFPDRRTPVDYLSDLRQFAVAYLKPWREVTLQDVDAFVDQQRQSGRKSSTVKRRVASLKTFFDFLAEETGDLSWPNPVRFKRHAGKQPRPLPRDLSDEQVERLWAVITEPRDRAWFALMLRAGLRVGEITSLKLTDLQPPTAVTPLGRLRVLGKGQKERFVLLTADAYAVLQAWLAVRPASVVPQVFLNERRRPLTPNGVEWLLRGYGERLGVKITPHQLRHTFARQVTEAGMPVTSLGKLLGHAQVSTTQIYTAGADPGLANAYQTAMSHLDTVTPTPVLPQPTAVPAGLAQPAATRPVPALPNWEDWASDLPPALRQASLAFVQRRLPTYSAHRRRQKALHDLAEFRRFWEWQRAHRPIAQPADLRPADLQAYQTVRAAQGKAASTINDTLDYVLALLREQADQGRPVEAGVFRVRPVPRPDSLPRHLTESEAQHLEAYVQARLERSDPVSRLENACFFVLAHTGLRASECVDLQVGDLDLNGGRLTVRQGKGQRDRVVYLSEVAQQSLADYLRTTPGPLTEALWLRPSGQAITYPWLLEHIARLGEAAEVAEVTPHRLRHTLATRLLNAGMDITRIQKLLGHDQISTTMIYARVWDATVEADYRQAMRQIERRQMPLSGTPELVPGWPIEVEQKVPLDNSV